MANEISINSSLTVSKGGADASGSSGTVSIDMTGTNMSDATQAVTSSVTAFSTGAVTTGSAYWLWAKNIGSTDVIVYQDSGGTRPIATISPTNVFGPVKVPSVVLYHKRSTTDTTLAVVACDS